MAINPTKASDIFSDDGAIQKLIDQLKTLNSEYTKAQQNIQERSKETEQRLNSLAGVTAEQREEIKRLAQGTDAMAKAYKKLDAALDENNATIKEVQATTQTVNQLRRLEAKINTNAKDSYNALSAEMSILKLRYKQMTQEQIKTSKEGQELTKRIKDINDTLKDLDANVGVHTRNVGNYRDALAELPGILGSTGRGVQGLKNDFDLISKNPFISVIGLIGGLLISLFNAFQRSEKGAQLLNKATGILNGVMSGLVKIATEAAEAVVSFVEDPLGSIKEFGKAIVTNITNRFVAALDIVNGFGSALKGLFQGDLDAFNNAMVDASKATATLITGLSENQFKAIGESIRKVAEETVTAANAFEALNAAKRENARVARGLTTEAERLATIQDVQQQIADDTTRSFREQQQALTKAQAAGEARARAEIQLARNNLALLNREISLRRANGEEVESLLDQQVGAIQAVAQAERTLTLEVANAARQRREIARDEFERELDFAIDFYDAQKTQLERRVGNEELAFEERVAILEKFIALDKSAFAEQIKLVEDFTKQRLSLNELALIEDERIVRERLRQYSLDDVTLGRILEILRERKAVTQDIADVERDLLELRNKGNQLDALPGFDYGKATEEKVLDRVQEITEKAAKRANETRNSLRDVLTGDVGLLEFIGLDFGDKQKEALQNSLQFVKDQFMFFANERKRIADQLVADSARAVQAAESEYTRQVQLQAAGLANTADTARQELAIQKKKQEEALAQQRKAQKAQQALQSIEQAGNLVTAVSKVYAALGFPLGLVAGGALFSAFAIARIKAASLSRQQFREGGLEILDGPSHEGGGVQIGFNRGRRLEAEGGEAMMILSKKATRQYKDILPDVFTALKTGTFEDKFMQKAAAGIPMIAVQSAQIDTSRMENHLAAIRKTSEQQTYIDHLGRTVVVQGNRKTVFEG